MHGTDTNTPKEVWDRYSSHQWVYFAEEIKQRISFFLSDRLWGKNLELGGGWYLTHPGSTVVDISPKALEYNPANEKIEFDLDDIQLGRKLPFPDHSFDHATMISVYQYLKGGKKFRDELMRVLKPGAELYIINMNGGGSGLGDGVVQGSTHIGPIKEEFSKAGFDTLVENIPFRADIAKVQSLCVAMPDIDLFGPTHGQIRDRYGRERINAIYSHYKPFSWRLHSHDEDEDINDDTRSIDHFTQVYTKRELRKMNDLFYKIATYPLTAFSVEYRKSLQAFTDECLAKTNCIPIITSYSYNEINIDMATKDRPLYLSFHIMGKTGKVSYEEREEVMKIAEKHRIQGSNTSGRFKGNTPDEIIANYEKQDYETQYSTLYDNYRKQPFSDTDQQTVISFLAEIPLNSVTKELQDRLYALVKSWGARDELILAEKDKQNMIGWNHDIAQWRIDMKERKARQKNIKDDYNDDEDEQPDKPRKPELLTRPWYCQIDTLITKKKAQGYMGMLIPRKQRREVDRLLKLKEQCATGEVDMAERKHIDYLAVMPYFPEIFEQRDTDAYKGSKMSSED